MCVMEMRPHQRTATLAQAMTHNISTVQRDSEMLVSMLVARGQDEHIDAVEKVRLHLQVAYQTALDLFAATVAEDHEAMDEPVGNEHVTATDLDIAKTAAHRAERYETR